jgi:hypothetical protein
MKKIQSQTCMVKADELDDLFECLTDIKLLQKNTATAHTTCEDILKQHHNLSGHPAITRIEKLSASLDACLSECVSLVKVVTKEVYPQKD